MKLRGLVVFLVFALSLMFITGCGTNVMEFAADDASTEACEYQASRDLNDGNFSDVIDSDCADSMQKGAAYFGAAGYDVTDMIERMVDANDTNDDIDIYLGTLVGTVSSSTLTNLTNSAAEYTKVVNAAGADASDAKYYRDVFVNPIKSLANLKGVIDPNGNGIDSACDNNSNGTPDEVDAASCALLTASGSGCASIPSTTVTSTVNPLTFTGYSSTYTGLVITVTGTDPDCSTDTYKRLNNNANNIVVATTSDYCTGSDSTTWNCPYEDESGTPVDLVTVLTDSLNSASSTAGTGEVGDAIGSLRTDICGADGICTSAEVSAYLQTM